MVGQAAAQASLSSCPQCLLSRKFACFSTNSRVSHASVHKRAAWFSVRDIPAGDTVFPSSCISTCSVQSDCDDNNEVVGLKVLLLQVPDLDTGTVPLLSFAYSRGAAAHQSWQHYNLRK